MRFLKILTIENISKSFLQYVTLMIGLNSPTKAALQNYGSKYIPVLQNSPNDRNKKSYQELYF